MLRDGGSNFHGVRELFTGMVLTTHGHIRIQFSRGEGIIHGAREQITDPLGRVFLGFYKCFLAHCNSSCFYPGKSAICLLLVGLCLRTGVLKGKVF